MDFAEFTYGQIVIKLGNFNMLIQEIIESKVHLALSPQKLDVINESHAHNVPKDAQTHFKLIVVADAFDGLSRVKRHQKIYGVLADELAAGVHALAMHLFTPIEWEQHQGVEASPKCLGGEKS